MSFRKIYIETSDICGLTCAFCPTKKGVRGVMSVEKFELVAKKVAKKAAVFTLHVLGDPLKNQNFADYVEVARRFEMPLEVTTSGFFLNDTNSEILLSQNNTIRQINISLTAVLGLSAAVEPYLKRIFSFCDKFATRESRRFLNLRVWSSEKCEKKEALLRAVFEKFGGFEGDLTNLKNGQIRLARHILLSLKDGFTWQILGETEEGNLQNGEFEVRKKGGCHGLLRQLGILADGSVVPCCMDASGVLKLGDIFTQTLGEVVNSRKAVRMKEGFLRGERVEEFCQKCEFFGVE